ncbi:hypothetical protein DVH24_012133 [Malus domestica]|uniref:Uncharacterized protein n=1 Tax=Malus domestica TaxID=3750 RepID=A0A498HNC1_MALDO|nr:hypothetical protein DVH24_012133 [Malus domestica]
MCPSSDADLPFKLLVMDLFHRKMIEYIEKKMAKLYSQFRHRLHRHYWSCVKHL